MRRAGAAYPAGHPTRTAGSAYPARYPTLLLATIAVVVLPACPINNVGEEDAVGREGRVLFTTETKLAFTSRLVAGSTFDVTIRANDKEDEDLLSRAVLASSDQGKMAVEPLDEGARVIVSEPGTYELIVLASQEDGSSFIDAIEVRAAVPAVTTLVDGNLFGATDSVDARLTSRFAIVTDVTNNLFVSAVDRCGGDLLDLHASTIEATGVPAVIEATGPAQFTLRTEVAGDLDITLTTPGLEPLEYAALSINPDAVDEVRPSASKLDNGQLTMWGRAFANDVELAGPLSFSWSADERVVLSALQGPAVIAAVSFPEEGQPPDDRPAVVTVEIFGEDGTLDLLGPLTQETTRGDPPRTFQAPPAAGAGCAGGEACNPEVAAAAFLGLVGLRRLRRALRNVEALSPRQP